MHNPYLHKTFSFQSPAKINLFLHITGQRPDGYHELQTIFQLIDLYDNLTFKITNNNTISLTNSDFVEIEKNLIYKSAQALLPYRKNDHLGCEVALEKNIPMGAGLGGGSSNAATTLLVLNQLWQCNLSQQQLLDIGVKLGADVPIFIYGQNAWAEGIGEQISILHNLPLKSYIILKPDCFISTQTLFSQKDLTKNSNKYKFAAYQDNTNLFGNNFEPLARKLYPEVEVAFQYLNQYGQAKLTGTGSCVFVEINPEVNDITQILNQAPYQSFFVNGIEQSPVITKLQTL